MDEKLVHDVTKTVFEKRADLASVHSEANNIELANQLGGGSPIPFHPGALKYFAEKGLQPKK
jgi:TRAP-type uncharacterized transport system substrate-binding protein